MKRRKRRQDVPESVSRFVRKQAQLAAAILDALDQKAVTEGERWTQRRLAQEMGKKESAISRLLSVSHPDEPPPDEMTEEDVEQLLRGTGNPTLKTIAEVEAALGHDLFVVPQFHEPTITFSRVDVATLQAYGGSAADEPMQAMTFMSGEALATHEEPTRTIGRQRV